MFKHVAVVNGPGGHGKDAFVSACTLAASGLGLDVANISSIDPCREAARLLGYNPAHKTDHDRAFLVALKHAWLQWDPYGPTRYIIRCIKGLENALIFVHIRETDQIELLQREASVMMPHVMIETIHIMRHGMPIPETDADRGTRGLPGALFQYDRFLVNDSDLAALECLARQYIAEIIGTYGIEGSTHNPGLRR